MRFPGHQFNPFVYLLFQFVYLRVFLTKHLVSVVNCLECIVVDYFINDHLCNLVYLPLDYQGRVNFDLTIFLHYKYHKFLIF